MRAISTRDRRGSFSMAVTRALQAGRSGSGALQQVEFSAICIGLIFVMVDRKRE